MRQAFGCGHASAAAGRCAFPYHLLFDWPGSGENDLLAEDDDLKAAYERAHELYLAFRHEIAVAMEDSEEHIEGTSAGGMPVRIKCLHALLAQTLVMGEGANPIGDMALEAIRHEFDPNVCRCTVENED